VTVLNVGDFGMVANKNWIADRRGYKDQDKWSEPRLIAEVTESTVVFEGSTHHINRHFVKLWHGPPPAKTTTARKQAAKKDIIKQSVKARKVKIMDLTVSCLDKNDDDDLDQNYIRQPNVIDVPDSSGTWIRRFGQDISQREKEILKTVGQSIAENIVNVATKLITNATGFPDPQARLH
jgi:hypothetical protein